MYRDSPFGVADLRLAVATCYMKISVSEHPPHPHLRLPRASNQPGAFGHERFVCPTVWQIEHVGAARFFVA